MQPFLLSTANLKSSLKTLERNSGKSKGRSWGRRTDKAISVKKMARNSSSGVHLIEDDDVDDLYISALYHADEIFRVSDEIYAQELQLQEALKFSVSHTNESSSSQKTSSPNKLKRKRTEEPQLSESFCGICMDTKTPSEMFSNATICRHQFCSDCIREHVLVKVKENVAQVKCPDPNCKGVIGPELCRSIVPKQVLERWENVLCESMILGNHKFYCPFKDCSAMLVDDGEKAVTSSECPNCNRLFCAQCKVAWHSGMGCSEFKSLKKDERNSDDMILMQLARRKKWRRCPKCKFFVEKRDGCLHISCRCGHHFCYGCGKKYDWYHACA